MNEQQHYCTNLIEVNKKQSVITNQDIFNEQGTLLLAKGAELSEKRAQVLLQHKLLKPLEQSVGIEASLDAKQLFAFLNKFALGVPALHAVTDNEHYQKTLRVMCLFYEKHPLLQQNLTVLALRAPKIYHEGIFSALAGLAIALKLNLSHADLQATFIAGLFHDVGFLYLPTELREKTQGFNENEWKALQAHPLIAQRFLSLVPGLSHEIGLAIVNHHERIDGTGYPRAIFGDQLSIVSQIIAITDNILFNQTRYEAYGTHVHKIILIALKLSDNIYFESVYNTALMLFKLAPSSSTNITTTPSPKKLLMRQKMLRKEFEHVKFLAQQLNTYSKSPVVRSINAVMGRLAVSVVRSGILQEEQDESLMQIKAGSNAEDDITLVETSVMHDQIYDQLVHLKNLMDRVVENIPDSENIFKQLAEKALHEINLQSNVAA